MYSSPRGSHAGEVASHLQAAGFEIRTQIVWHNSRFAISRGSYHWQREPCWYGVRAGAKGGAKWCGDRSQSTVWDVPSRDDGTGETVHVQPKRLAFFKVGKELRERVNSGAGGEAPPPTASAPDLVKTAP